MEKLAIFEKRAFIEGAKRTGKIRDPAWLERLAQKGLVAHLPPEKAQAFRKQMETAVKVLDEIHGENWDFTLYHDSEGKKAQFELGIAIHYPELEISNSEGKRHTILDLYAVLPFEKNPASGKGELPPLAIHRLLATRATLTGAEADTGYRHSHTRRVVDFDRYRHMGLSNFCDGHNSELSLQMMETTKDFSPETFGMLLWNTTSALEWESLESTPYVRISTIVDAGDEPYCENSNRMEDHLRRAMEHISTRGFGFTIAAEKFSQRYAIRNTKAFERELHRAITATGDENTLYGTLSIRQNGKWMAYRKGTVTRCEDMREKPTYVHRNRTVEFRILGENESTTNINDYQVHPKFLSYAKDRIEQELHLYAAKALAAEREAIAGNRP